MTEILLHPGFHKTGTSSIQHFLWLNRATLNPYFTTVLLRHLKPVVQMACRFSRTQNPIDLLDVVPALDAALAKAAVRPARTCWCPARVCWGICPAGPTWTAMPRHRR